MKAKWLKELNDLIREDRFQQWFEELRVNLSEFEDFTDQLDELATQNNLLAFRSDLTHRKATDTLFKAGDYEDRVAEMRAEADKAENRSFEAVGNFENQRVLVSDLWYKLGGVEHSLQEAKDTLEQAQRELEEGKGVKAQLKGEIRRLKDEIKTNERRLRKISQQYHRESQRKSQYWEEVERMWNKSLNIYLGIAEQQRKSKQFRRQAERMFKQSEKTKQHADHIQEQIGEREKKRDKAAHKIEELYREAAEKFDCISGEDFLYWPQKENSKKIYCLALLDDDETYNIEIKTQNLYQVGLDKGVNFIEPLKPEATMAEEEDGRLDEFFTVGRP